MIRLDRTSLHSNAGRCAHTRVCLSVYTRCILWISSVFLATQSLGINWSCAVSVVMCVAMAYDKHLSSAKKLLIALIVIRVIYELHAEDLPSVLWMFSPFLMYRCLVAYPVYCACYLIGQTPSGQISEACARMRIPKKVVLGVMVLFRFLPSFKRDRQLQKDALCQRGLISIRQLIKDPILCAEYIIAPMLLSLETAADQLSISALARGAEKPGSRRSYYALDIDVRDMVCLGVFFGVSVCFYVLRQAEWLL